MYNSVGNLVWQADLDIYGKVRTLSKGNINDCPFRYQGQYHDTEIDLYYNRYRYYSAESGAYISQDPIGLFSGEPNFYAYVHNINTWIDPLGLNKFLNRPPKGKAYLIRVGEYTHYKTMDSKGNLVHLVGTGDVEIKSSSLQKLKVKPDDTVITIDAKKTPTASMLEDFIDDYDGLKYNDSNEGKKLNCFTAVIDYVNRLGANLKVNGQDHEADWKSICRNK